jgi:hypothetical protein
MAGKVFFSVSMSLDGFIAPESLEDLMGQQWMELQQWIFPQRFIRENLKLSGPRSRAPLVVSAKTMRARESRLTGQAQRLRSRVARASRASSLQTGRTSRDRTGDPLGPSRRREWRTGSPRSRLTSLPILCPRPTWSRWATSCMTGTSNGSSSSSEPRSRRCPRRRIVIESLIDDDRRENVSGLMASLNMLIEFGDAFNFTGADLEAWCKDVGFRTVEVVPLAGPGSAGVAYK